MTAALATPSWRETAPAGVSLAQARKLAPIEAASSPNLSRILRPQAIGRWLMPSVAAITPTYIETVLRGALMGSHQNAHELFQLMEDTWPRLTKNANQLKREVVTELCGWRARPYEEEDEPPTESAIEKAKLVNAALRSMMPEAGQDENDFEATVYDLLDAWLKGVSVLEINWTSKRAGSAGEIITPISTIYWPCHRWGWAEEGWLGIIADGNPGTMAGKNQVMPFPPDKFMVGICKARSGHAVGGALLRALAWWWCAANFSADWLLNFAQIFGLPFRWANYATGTSEAQVTAICAMLQNMGSAGWAAFPAGTTLELKEAGHTGQDTPQGDMLDRADRNCDLLILGQTLTSDVSQNAGSRSQGEVHERVKNELTMAAAGWVARVFNTQLIPSIIRLNYGAEAVQDDLPQFKGADEEPGTLSFKREMAKLFGQSPTLGNVVANMTDIKGLVRDVGLTVQEDYEQPEMPTADQMPPPQAPGTGTPPPGNDPNAEDESENETPPAEAVQASLKPLPPEKLIEKGADVYAMALAQDLAVIRKKIESVSAIQNEEVFQQRALELVQEIESLRADITRLPKAGQALAGAMFAAVLNGLTKR